MNRSPMLRLVEDFGKNRILVIGDIMLDEFVWGRAKRISPEAPVPVIDIQEESYALGGAGNVVANIKALGGHPVPVGVIGLDRWSDAVVSLMAQKRISTAGIHRVQGRQTTVKTRLMAQSTQQLQQIARADRGHAEPLDRVMIDVLKDTIFQEIQFCKAVIVSDYDKGVATGEVLTYLMELASQYKIPVFIDPKLEDPGKYRGATLVKPNHREAELISGIAIDDEESLCTAGKLIRERLHADYVLITNGDKGMSLFSATLGLHLKASAPREVFDATGAGDTVISALALAYVSGGSMAEAAALANIAAGLAVCKIGTDTVSMEELVAQLAGRETPGSVMAEIMAERAAQDIQWGGPDHDDTHTYMEWLEFIMDQISKAGGIEPEHEGPTQTTEEERRVRLIKIAALAVAAIESFDRMGERESVS